ncbi:hypothetical protein HY732_05330 [Candidatus Uhrbacteria bacterium]|nr:hypothetical protein [Candidatus Uhrbacteria bacterium]
MYCENIRKIFKKRDAGMMSIDPEMRDRMYLDAITLYLDARIGTRKYFGSV